MNTPMQRRSTINLKVTSFSCAHKRRGDPGHQPTDRFNLHLNPLGLQFELSARAIKVPLSLTL